MGQLVDLKDIKDLSLVWPQLPAAPDMDMADESGPQF